MNKEYTPLQSEPEILKKWASITFKPTKKDKKYILEMFPYPSGHLHMGHVRNYTIGDVQARFYRMQGYNVMYPMGFDSFGLPAENAAIKNNINPLEWTEKNIAHMKLQLQALGLSYDWATELSTSRKNYYKWNQWLFKKFYDAGLIYRKKGYVNWDPIDNTVLANEQVIDGKGWRSGAIVEKKEIAQWYIKITDYAEELLEDLEQLEHWPERVKNMQRQWIGKNTGTIITFNIESSSEEKICNLSVFTTRPDTLMGATYVSIAPEHDQLKAILKHTSNQSDCEAYIQNSLKKQTAERSDTTKEKTGIKVDVFAIHPISNKKIPLYIADYVLTDYGTGAVMAVPAHDDRDHSFSKKYDLPMIQVIESDQKSEDIFTKAYTKSGTLINSGEFNGLTTDTAKTVITNRLKSLNKGEHKAQFKLRDWLISRQRYWGTPIPIIYDNNGEPQPVNENDLPIELPTDVNFQHKGNPIESSNSFKTVTINNETFQRETDTMDTFFDSSWYFFRYLSPLNSSLPYEKSRANQFCPVDYYIGGIEHACLHLLYARFFTKACRDLGLHNINEPFSSLICQGMVLKDGAKMSKSLGNTVDPNTIIETYGADTARIFILFGAPVDKDLDYTDDGVEGSFRFLKRFYNTTVNHSKFPVKDPKNLKKQTHKVIKKMTNDIKNFQFNTAISQLMSLMNTIGKIGTTKETAEIMTKLIAPFAPFIADAIWEDLGHTSSIHQESWPAYEDALTIDDEITIAIQVNGKIRDKITVSRDTSNEALTTSALAQENVKKHIDNKELVKTIVVPERLINFVVK